jgi:hypothetical protein
MKYFYFVLCTTTIESFPRCFGKIVNLTPLNGCLDNFNERMDEFPTPVISFLVFKLNISKNKYFNIV